MSPNDMMGSPQRATPTTESGAGSERGGAGRD
jgi:hypothetical protein